MPQTTMQPTYRDMAEVIKLDIIAFDFPTTIWSDTKLYQIQTAMLDKIVELNLQAVCLNQGEQSAQ